MAKKRMSMAAAAKSISKREGIPVKNAMGILVASNKAQAAKKKKGKKNGK